MISSRGLGIDKERAEGLPGWAVSKDQAARKAKGSLA